MRYLFLALLGALILVGCKTTYVPVETKTTVTETVRDTIVEVQLEREYVKRVIPDTASTVETRYARSTATWHGDSGTLEHSIENKPDSIPVRIQYIERKEVIEKPVPYPVEVKVPVDRPVRMPLRWWERIFVYSGMAALGGGVLWIAVRLSRK